MNVYRVYIDDPIKGDVEVWTMQAENPASAITKVMRRVRHGKSRHVEDFSVSAELLARNMTYTEYKAIQAAKSDQ